MKAIFEITHLKIPLSPKKTYQAHWYHMKEHDICIVKATNAEGKVGYGEYIRYPNYDPFCGGSQESELCACAEGRESFSPFITTAVNTAIETIGLEYPKMKVPIVGLVSNITRFPDEVKSFVASEYKAIKANIFPQLESVPELVAKIDETVKNNPDIEFRFNAGELMFTDYIVSRLTFLTRPNVKVITDFMPNITRYSHAMLARDLTMWFETDFEKYVSRYYRVPGLSGRACQVYNLRLPKHGALLGLERMATKLQTGNLQALFGSDVGSDICAMNEMLAYTRTGQTHISEITGFIKQTDKLVKGLSYAKGFVTYSGGKFELDADTVKKYTVGQRAVTVDMPNPFTLREYPRRLW